jgi:DNA-binding response OmpR family regulator
MKLLLVEDDAMLGKELLDYLKRDFTITDHALSLSEAKEKVAITFYDCILLDLGLPDGSGMELIQMVRNSLPGAGIIILSAKGTPDERIEGLNAGADDYLAKPFVPAELTARIYSVYRRKNFQSNNILKIDGLSIDILARKVAYEGTDAALTRTEFDLLLLFTSNRRKVLSKQMLAEYISGDLADMMDDHEYVYAHVKNLKKKLRNTGFQVPIQTIYASGYRWEL